MACLNFIGQFHGPLIVEKAVNYQLIFHSAVLACFVLVSGGFIRSLIISSAVIGKGF